MKKRFYYLLLPIVTLILEILPFGAVCNFATPEGEPFRVTFSYFDLTPFGYANFAPLLTAILTCLAVIWLLLFCIKGGSRAKNRAKTVLAVATVASLGPLYLGASYFTAIAGLITFTLATEWLLLHLTAKKPSA